MPIPANPKMAPEARRLRRFRVDAREIAAPGGFPIACWLASLACAAAFVMLGGGALELDAAEARLGLAIGEPFGPLGRAFGGWDFTLWPGKVLAGKAWAASGIDRMVSSSSAFPGAVRWPSALAALGIGFIAARRLALAMGPRAGAIAAACLFGSLGLIDRSNSLGIDPMAGLGVVAALDRILARGSGWIAGLWATLAVLTGGWPALAAILLPVVVLGRSGSSLSWGLVVPPVAALIGWSMWALKAATPEAWAAAMAWPLTRKIAWWLPAQVAAAGLPWAPFAILAAWPSVRDGWAPEARRTLQGWTTVAGASLIAGTFIPGLADAMRLPALVGVLLLSAASLDRAWAGLANAWPRRTFGRLAVAACVALGRLDRRGDLPGAAQPFYRAAAIGLLVAGQGAGVLAVAALFERKPPLLISAVLMVAIGVKLAHAGIYGPEWAYRFGQGPWGRAVAQWVPPNWPIYTVHNWPADFALAAERPFRQLVNPKSLGFEPQDRPHFVLLDPGEFEHWDPDAPPLVAVREFQGPRGETRVLARTRPGASIQPARGTWRASSSEAEE
ncbi:MAG: hypothetical protein U0800_00445 [Isosphaeraceae bacterium]